MLSIHGLIFSSNGPLRKLAIFRVDMGENLKEQKIAIIGGSSGIGLASAQILALKGATVLIGSRSLPKLEAAQSKITGNVQIRQLDFTDKTSVSDFFASSGKLDHLVITAAGRPAWGSFRDLKTEALASAMETKFQGYFLCLKSAISVLRKDGSVTLVAGAACRAAIPGTAGIAAVNGAIIAMARTLARELAPLRINLISAGVVDTPAYHWMPEADRKAFFKNMTAEYPINRVGEPHEIADAVCFLTCNSFVTGALIDIDGGAHLM